MRTRLPLRLVSPLLAIAGMVCAVASPASAQSGNRFLGREDIVLLGAGLRVEPARQTVPKDIATIVSTYLQAPDVPSQPLPPFAPDAVVRATLRGPSFSGPVHVTARPNTPFNIPPLSVPGTHTLDEIRLESGGAVVLRGAPESVIIDVIEKLLVTQVVARAMTADEIRERGIVFDKSNFQAYNFTAAFAVGDAVPIPINFPVVLPVIQETPGVALNEVGLPRIDPPTLVSLQTIIPDTLRLQTQIPNLSVIGFTLKVPQLQGQQLIVPPIPGVIVIPGDIGFLNQFFNVTLIVGNVAPEASGLVVSELRAEIVLPPGFDTVPNSADDPLGMARTQDGESARVQLVVQPGPDGKLGTADDVGSLGPGDSGSAEYLVEGRREGTHVIEMEMSGTLTGLPVGPVTVRGRAAGSVLVRNPTFTLTFTHPDLVNAGEPYTLDVTVTNTSESPANFVSVNLYSRNLTGAVLVGDASRDIEFIAPGDSATVSFDLIAQVSGPVTAATLDSDDNVQGRFALKTSVGELGIPLSPDSLVLPSQANSLPAGLRRAALGLLGKGWALATAPAAAVPPDVRRFSKKIVYDRAIELAEAGFRYSLHEPLAATATHLAFDYLGNGYARLGERTAPADLPFVQSDYRGFDELRRRSVRGDVFAGAVAAILAPELAAQGASDFHRGLADTVSFRPGHLSVLIASAGGPLPFRLRLLDSAGRAVGGTGPDGRVIKDIPFGDLLTFGPPDATTGEMAVLAAPENGDYQIVLERVPGSADRPFTLSIVVPDAAGVLQHRVAGMTAASRPDLGFTSADPIRLTVDVRGGDGPGGGAQVTKTVIVDRAPWVMSAVQQADADVLHCAPGDAGWRPGRVLALLFSEDVTAEAVQDRVRSTELTRYAIDGNQVVSVALQPGRRIAFLALRDPIGPLVPRTITVTDVTDRPGQPMAAQAVPIEATVVEEGGVVSGQVLRADGTPAAFTSIRLFYTFCSPEPTSGLASPLRNGEFGISSKSTDEQGRFSWDYVLKRVFVNRVTAVDLDSGDVRSVPFTISRNGQRLNVNVVFLGRGTFTGRTVDEAGAPLAGTAVKVTSLTDDTQYGATTDAQGRFTIGRVPVGNIFVEAVNGPVQARGTLAEFVPLANAIVTRDVTLFSEIRPRADVKYGVLRGFVLRADGRQPVADVPVVAYYQNVSQAGVHCPGEAGFNPDIYCPIALARTGASGEFLFDRIPAGRFRLTTIDQATYQQGVAGAFVTADATFRVNVLMSQGLGTVRGVVLDASGGRVAGARVGGGLSLTTTDANGEFALVDVPVGRQRLVAVSDALQAQGAAEVDLVRPGDEQNVAIVLSAVGSVSGTVFQPNGTAPIPNAKVYLFKPGACGEDSCIDVIGSATTNATGQYNMAGVPAGAYQLSSFSAGFTDGNVVPAVLQFNNQLLRVDVVYRGGGGRIAGVTLDDDGQTPLAASVGISGEQVVVAGGLVGTGFKYVQNFRISQTDISSGQFAFNGLWVGPITLQAVGQFSPDPISFETSIPAPGATVNVELRLQPTASLAGVVFQPDGVTPVGSDVIVRFASDAFRWLCNAGDCQKIAQGVQNFTVVTDAQGRYLINPVNAGPFTITVEDPSTGRLAEIHGDVRAGQDAEFDVRLLQRAAVTVRVRGSDGQTPIPGARVVVRQTEFPKREISLVAGADGDALFAGANALAEGDFSVLATDLRNGFAGRVSGAVPAESDVVSVTAFLFDQAGSVAGILYAPDGLTPVANAEVLVRNQAGPLAFAVTDAVGHYRAETIPLGEITLEAFEAATARRAFGGGRIDFANQEAPINLVQLGLGQVTGRVLQAGSLGPLKNWDVRLTQTAPSGAPLATLRSSTGVDGAFSFPGASVGSFTIRAHRERVSGQGRGEGTIDRHGQTVDVPVIVVVARDIFGRIEGVVRDPDGVPGANSNVTLFAEGLPLNGIGVTAGPDGAFAFEGIRVGRFLLKARAQVGLNAGDAQGEITFEGETARPVVVLVGVGRVTGTVYQSDGVSPAPFAEMELYGIPSSGCPARTCAGAADGNGTFSFDAVPARSFTVTALDRVSGLKGVAADLLTPGTTRDVRIVLQPSARLSARVLFSSGRPARGVVGNLTLPRPPPEPARQLFASADSDGGLIFPVVPSGGPYTLQITDPLGPGLAARTVQVSTGELALGDIVLDDTPPMVVGSTPAAGAAGVPRDAVVQITFSEPLATATITSAHFTIGDSSRVLPALIAFDQGETRVTITPLAPLAENTLYTLTVRNVSDRLGKRLVTPFVARFTSIDLTPPQVVELSPQAGGHGTPIYAPVRITYSEPIDPARFSGTPLTVFDGSSAVEGRIDVLFGNTVVVFTPTRPLRDAATYRVAGPPAVDLSGNVQPQGLDYLFTTTDRTPPQITALRIGGGAADATVIENAVTPVVAEVGASADVAFVDFYVNDVLTSTSRTAPFTLQLLAAPALGAPGSQIKVSAVATDTSGNRGASAVSAFVRIVADTPAAVTILAPADGALFRSGERVAVIVRVTDDLGIRHMGYRAETGRTQDAATVAFDPATATREETFGFNVPLSAAPGSRLRIHAVALDTKGQASASELSIVVVDAVPPTVTITGTSTGARVRPGQATQVIVSAEDAGAIRELSFQAVGAVAVTETRAVDPAQPAVAASFTIQVPLTARAGDTITLRARAIDVAGNAADAAPVTLPVADLNPPTVVLRTSTGRLDAAPGRSVTVLVEAEDETGVTRVDLQGAGAFAVSDARALSPPIASASVPFDINIPESATPGQVLTLSATATDLFGNLSAPATLALTIRSVTTVTLPPSVILLAGEEADVTLDLGEPAPAAGAIVTLTSTQPNVASVLSPVIFAAGESTKTARVIGVSGGNATITASIQGVQRASMTATVQGGVVRGTVLGPDSLPVGGALVSVTSPLRTTVTDAAGAYQVEGVGGGFFGTITVKVADPSTNYIGYASGALNVPNGSVRLNVVLIAAGRIAGTALLADGVTPAGPGVRVDIYEGSNVFLPPLQTVFTDDGGRYEFPIVTLGTYTVDTSDTNGNRGRAAATLTHTGEELELPVQFLGRGTVVGTVRSGASPVPNAPVTFDASSQFGTLPRITRNADADGAFRFEGVPVGSFTVQAVDGATNLAGTTSGQIAANNQVVTADVSLAQHATLTGIVYRADGVTPVAGALVRVQTSNPFAVLDTRTDEMGRYTRAFVPLGNHTLEAREASTRGIARVTGVLGTHLGVVTRDLTFLPQGSVIVTVNDANGVRVPGARISLSAFGGTVSDNMSALTDANGMAIIEHVLAGTLQLNASGNNLVSEYLTRTLAAAQVLQVTLTLQPTASIVGTLFSADGQTPVGNGFVDLQRQNYSATPVAADGSFRFDGLRLGSYPLYGYDSTRRLRAFEQNVVLDTNGQAVRRDLTMVGIGTVFGRVINPDQSPAGNVFVTVRSLNANFGGYQSSVTDANGNYIAAGVAVGAFIVTAGSGTLLAESNGTLAQDGASVERDLLLVNSAVALPVTKYDANGAPWGVQRSGETSPGLGFSLGAGGFALDIAAGSVTTTFAGDTTFGTTEDGSREVVVRQQAQPIAGLSVTRKVFVPRSYFARYLELLTNPTSEPITVDVRIRTSLAYTTRTVLGTSSGDDVLDVSNADAPDRWLAIRGSTFGDRDAFESGSPSLAFVFDGPGAAARASVLTMTNVQSGTLTYGWSSVTIQPGETAGFMHFGAQQYDNPAGLASAERLVQLPPEALAGLSPQEIAAVRNFALPADGVSALEALPPFATSITGRLLEADGVTPIANATGQSTVRLRSSVVYFGRRYSIAPNALGTFTFTHTADSAGFATVSLPLAGFNVQAYHPVTFVLSPLATGAFPDGESTTTRDVVFGNTSVLSGTVRRHTGVPVNGGTVTIANAGGSFLPLTPSVVIGSDGKYRISGVPDGTFLLTAQLNLPPGANGSDTRLTGTAPVTVVSGRQIVQDLPIVPTGFVAGTLRSAAGAPVTNALVELWDQVTFFRRFANTSTAGVFVFNDVPVGTYTLRARDAATAFYAQSTVAVVVDQTTTQDLAYLATGSVVVTVTAGDGAPVANARVDIQRSTSTFMEFTGRTDTQGRFTIANVPAGGFTVEVEHPLDGSRTSVSGTMPAAGGALTVAVQVPSVANLLVQVRVAGQPMANAPVTLRHDGLPFERSQGSTNAAGDLTLTNVRGAYTVRVSHPLIGSVQATASGTVTANGQLIPVLVQLPPTGSVTGVVRDRAGAPVANTFVFVRSLAVAYQTGASSDASGRYTVARVPGGDFIASVEDPQRRLAGSARGTITTQGEIVQADIVLNGVYLSHAFTDGNGRTWNVLPNGAIGSESFQSGWRYGVSAKIEGGFDQFFHGRAGAELELADRQVVIADPTNQSRPLDISRKVYIPADGYFVRYLETFENRGTVPLTFRASTYAEYRPGYGHSVLATASGDAAIDPQDAWVVTGVQGASPDEPRRAFSHVLFGAEGARGLGSVVSENWAQYVWEPITLQPGERATIVQFVGEHRSESAARGAAERLVQLPPEALAGLTPLELAAIRNFAAPPDGQSAVAPFTTFMGRVLSADRSSGVADVPVVVSAANPLLDGPRTTVSGADGAYSAAYPAVSGYTLRVTDPATGVPNEVAGTLAPGQAVVVRDLVLSSVAAIRGRVLLDGVPVAAGDVRLLNVATHALFTAAITPEGQYAFEGLPGRYQLTALAGGRGSDTVEITAGGGDTYEQDLQLTLFAGRVRVRLFAVDGLTPIRSGSVVVRSGMSGDVLASSSYTDASGAFVTPVFIAPAGGFRIAVVGYTGGGGDAASAEQSATFGQPDEALDVAITLPVSIVRGVVTYADGTPVPSGYVQARQMHPAGYVDWTTTITEADGRFALLGLRTGAFALVVQDRAPRLLSAEIVSVMSEPSVPVIIDAQLPQGGTVRVPAPAGLSVTLTTNAAQPWEYATVQSDADTSTAVFERVPAGRVAVQGCVFFTTFCFAGSGVVEPGGSLQVTPKYPASGALGRFRSTVFAPDGMTPLANTSVLLMAGELTPLGGGRQYLTTGPSGQLPETYASVGPMTLSTSYPTPGLTVGSVPGDGDAGQIDLVTGNAVAPWFNIWPNAAGGLVYGASCDGSLYMNNARMDPFSGYRRLQVNGLALPCLAAARVELDGRQYVYGPYTVGGLTVTRKIFVPAVGGFARYLDILENQVQPLPAPNPDAPDDPVEDPNTDRTADVQVSGPLTDPVRVVRAPAETGGTYMVTDGGDGSPDRPVVAEVFGTAGAASAPLLHIQSIGGESHARYPVTVAPGQTRTIMHFVAVRAAGEAAGAESQAQALVNGTDADMFSGLTAEQRLQIINFVIR